MKNAGTIKQCLREQGFAIVPIYGTSMWPLLKEGESRVQVVAKERRCPQRGDIVLYQRKDGTYVLHRIVREETNHSFLICGDHQWKPLERVEEEQILAVAQGFFRSGRYIDDQTWWYRLYKLLWNHNLTVRRCCLILIDFCFASGRYWTVPNS